MEDMLPLETMQKEKIIGQGNIGNDTFSLIENVLLVDDLKYNL